MSIKRFFKSRFVGGKIVEGDYSQLEIRVLAELSGDKQLMRDVDETDLHSIRAAEWKGKRVADVTPLERRLAKTISFQLQYGAGFKSIAATNNITIEEAKSFVEAYYRRYPSVVAWQERVMAQVVKSRVPSSKRTKAGVPAGEGKYICPVTSREYTFYEKDGFTRAWGKDVGPTFYAPEVKNYPVQGLATGDIVPMVLGRLSRHMLRMGYDSLLVNTVHDSIVIDAHPAEVDEMVRVLKNIMELAPEYIKEDYEYVMRVELPVDVKVGESWDAMA